MLLKDWGWDSSYEEKFRGYRKQDLAPGRIVLESRHLYEVETESGRMQAKVSGHYRYTAANRADYPTIGDWVALKIEDDIAIIEKLIERKSSFSRKRAGNEIEEQVIAANIDYIFLVFGLDGGRHFSLGGLERFLIRSWDSGAIPVIILNKSDLCDDVQRYVTEAETVSAGTEIHVTSASTGEGLDNLSKFLHPGKTVAFTGFSGVGKSALINKLCGVALMKTGNQREQDHKGKHTTTRKELIKLKNGAILIDSPGIKELQLWGNEESLNNTFDDISLLAANCRYKNCSHQGEPGCAVQRALTDGQLDQRRYDNFLIMKKELRYLEAKQDTRSKVEEKARIKKFSKMVKSMKK